MKGVIFETKLENIERSAWKSFTEVVKKFLGNSKYPDFKNIGPSRKHAGELESLGLLNEIGAPLFELSSISYFPENLPPANEEQVGQELKDVKEMERRFQGRQNVNLIAE